MSSTNRKEKCKIKGFIEVNNSDPIFPRIFQNISKERKAARKVKQHDGKEIEEETKRHEARQRLQQLTKNNGANYVHVK